MMVRIGPLPVWMPLVVAAAGLGVAWAIALPPGFPAGGRFSLALRAMALLLVLCGILVGVAAWRGAGRTVGLWLILAAVWAAVGIGLIVMETGAVSSCLVRYESEVRIGGDRLTPHAAAYLEKNKTLTREELLLDAAGETERVWTRDSIEECRTRLQAPRLGGPGVLAAFLFSVLAAVAVRRQGVLGIPSGKTRAQAGPGAAPVPVVYDVFVSYRRLEPDRSFVIDLVNRMESEGLKVVIDERDFRPNEHFLMEMERCIRQSRFTLCVLTRAYLASGNCEEEAVITKVLDMGERKRRLVPLFLEEMELPVWLFGLVGVNFFRADPMVDPTEKLMGMLKAGRD